MGVRLAVDYGTVRVGLAKSDPAGKVAIPLTTLGNDDALLKNLVALVVEEAAKVIYVGLPLNLKGEVTQSAKKVLDFAIELSEALPDTPVLMIDERFTSKTAGEQLQQAGLSARESRGLVDQVSALGLLEQALQIEARTDNLAGSRPKDWIFK